MEAERMRSREGGLPAHSARHFLRGPEAARRARGGYVRWLCAVAVVSVGSTAFVPACSLEPREYPDEPPISFECESHADCDDGEACSKEYCDEHGLCVRSNDDDYVPDDDNECTDDRCVERAPFWLPRTGQTCGGHNGAALCDADGECVGCEAIFSEADCGSEKWCDVDRCVFKREHGEPCIMGLSCISGFCSDGVCCDAPCQGKCLACREEHTNQPTGECHSIASGKDPAGECYPLAGCNGQGGCVKEADGTPCGVDSECGSNFCVNGVCCGQACTEACRVCNSPGQMGSCAPAPQGSDPGDRCFGTSTCDAIGACTPLAVGESCDNHSQCATGFCFDLFCCNEYCGGTCRSCGLSGSVGSCSPIPAGTDPANECAGTCNGAGACQ